MATVAFVGWIPPVADQEGGHLLRGVAVIVSQNVRIGLQEESNIGVADPLGPFAHAVGVPQSLVRLCVSVIGGVPVDFVFLDDVAVGVEVLGARIDPAPAHPCRQSLRWATQTRVSGHGVADPAVTAHPR
jgi:hypothetical protein